MPHIDYASPSSGYTPGLYIYGGQASPTIYLTSSNVIVDVGNVGIGTSSPAAKLEVSGGPIKATGGLILNTTNADPATPVPGQIWLRTDIG